MKKFFYYTSRLIAVTLIFYVVGCFMSGSFNIKDLNENARFVLGAVLFFGLYETTVHCRNEWRRKHE